MKQLATTAEVIDALGIDALCAMFGVKPNAVTNWRAFGLFPPYTGFAIKEALNKRELDAPNELWKSSSAPRRKGGAALQGEAAQ